MSSVLLRDVPHSFTDLAVGWIPKCRKEFAVGKNQVVETEEQYNERIAKIAKIGKYKKYLPIFTSGAGLFSDGYVNNSIGIVTTCLKKLYPTAYGESNAIKNVSSIAFVGTVVGQIVFGYIADYHSRKFAMIAGSCILIIFAILCAGSWGLNGSVNGMFAALTAYRFFLGIGIGSEYPAGSTACAEAANLLPPSKRNRWFCWFTNLMIVSGFVVSAFVPMVLLWICTPNHLTPVWRVTLGFGAIPPISLFILRLFFQEADEYQKYRFKHVKVPYWSVIKYYWFRLLICSIIWFIYDFTAYGFGLFSSLILSELNPKSDLYVTFGWNIVFYLFYIPGAFLGAIGTDILGPRLCLFIGITLQSMVGYIMAGCFETLKKHIAGFVVAFGIFMTLGNFGPGSAVGVLAAKTCCTPLRGQYYAVAAAIGKVGAFVGTYCFTPLTTKYGTTSAWWLASSLGLFAGVLGLVFLPAVDAESAANEDREFLLYLESTGFDISQLGLNPGCADKPAFEETETEKDQGSQDDEKNSIVNISVGEYK